MVCELGFSGSSQLGCRLDDAGVQAEPSRDFERQALPGRPVDQVKRWSKRVRVEPEGSTNDPVSRGTVSLESVIMGRSYDMGSSFPEMLYHCPSERSTFYWVGPRAYLVQ
jgi:hypothetical protein